MPVNTLSTTPSLRSSGASQACSPAWMPLVNDIRSIPRRRPRLDEGKTMRTLRLLVLFSVCLATPAVAGAEDGGWIEWLEKMSGPGPYWGAGAFVRLACWNTKNQGAYFCYRNPETYRTDDGKARDPTHENAARPKDERHILALGVGFFKTFDGKPRFADTPDDTRRVRLFQLEPRYYYRFHEVLDAGVGISIRRFSGEETGDFTPLWRVGVTPASIVFPPGAIGTGDNDNPWRRFIKLHLDETWIPALSAQKDFNSKSTYATDGEFLASF